MRPMKPGKASPVSFFAPGVRIPLNTPKYCTFLYLQPCREKEEGIKPLRRGGGSQILSSLASVASVFGAGSLSSKAASSGELKAILLVSPVHPSLL